jgi:ABC-2 type transport system permease protein
MNRSKSPLWRLIVASTMMYFRNKTAIFFSILFPIIFLVVFGFVGQSDTVTIDISYINRSETPPAQQFDQAFGSLILDDNLTDEENESRIFRNNQEILDLYAQEGYNSALEKAKQKLEESDLSAAVLVPPEFGESESGEVAILVDASDQQFAGIVENTVSEILGGFNAVVISQAVGGDIPEPYTASSEPVQSSDLGGVDYLVPGIIAFSVMSLGVFSVSQGFIYLKSSGALRRLHVAPLNPLTFLTAQSVTRLMMTALNVLIMVAIAVLLFSFTVRGTIFEFVLFSIIGAIMFLGMGFAIAGWAKDEDQAAPISNIIFFPMMFLSGTFFPIELFPEWLKPLASILPLTFLADGLREIANLGAHIWDLGPELAGIAIWTVIVYVIAVKVFRWE